jgi:hypothetical protein
VSGYLLTDRDLAPEREIAKEPAKRWRNWFRASILPCLMPCADCGRNGWFEIGETFTICCVTWPSKDTAETWAHEHNRFSQYLGAYPDGERP